MFEGNVSNSWKCVPAISQAMREIKKTSRIRDRVRASEYPRLWKISGARLGCIVFDVFLDPACTRIGIVELEHFGGSCIVPMAGNSTSADCEGSASLFLAYHRATDRTYMTPRAGCSRTDGEIAQSSLELE